MSGGLAGFKDGTQLGADVHAAGEGRPPGRRTPHRPRPSKKVRGHRRRRAKGPAWRRGAGLGCPPTEKSGTSPTRKHLRPGKDLGSRVRWGVGGGGRQPGRGLGLCGLVLTAGAGEGPGLEGRTSLGLRPDAAGAPGKRRGACWPASRLPALLGSVGPAGERGLFHGVTRRGVQARRCPSLAGCSRSSGGWGRCPPGASSTVLFLTGSPRRVPLRVSPELPPGAACRLSPHKS